MLARRFSCPAVHEAAYEPRDVPNGDKDMKNTVILRPQREEWLQLLGEMVQITNEAVRRRASCARDASKPLSLEYMADRCDVDDPLFGYLAVTKDKGWMQGFVTCTTFTTWHRGFRWDSTNPLLELGSGPHGHHASPEKKAKTKEVANGSSSPSSSTGGTQPPEPPRRSYAIDADGKLSHELMTEVHAGDPDNEGVVWPRVAELSLLGALGCGRWLVQLILDGLEAPDSPYRYVVTQATDGSIPFYERMGFVRVGALTAEKWKHKDDDDDTQPAKRQKSDGAASSSQDGGEVVSRSFEHTCEEGETCASIASKYGLHDAYEVLFLNQRTYPKLHQHAALRQGTTILVPKPLTVEEVREEEQGMVQTFHVVTGDTDTLRKVADQIGIQPRELLDMNKGAIKGLQLSSMLLRGTRLQTSGKGDYELTEYCHWTFPDEMKMGEPSYMMAKRLKPFKDRKPIGSEKGSVIERTKALLVRERPAIVPSESRKMVFERMAKEKAEKEEKQGAAASSSSAVDMMAANAAKPKLFNRVVHIEGETSYDYWYVLTYLPDLQWCHVAPLEQRGVFTKEGRSKGRPKWMLVSEDECCEIDVGAGRCVIMTALEVKGGNDADQEEWDVIEEESKTKEKSE